MDNFKDYLNFSPNLADNLYKMRLIALNEAKKKKAKKTKRANKDYDGDGKVESGSEEYLGSRKKAIEKAIAMKKGKKLNEAKAGLPNEMIVDLIRSNSHEGYDPKDAEQYPLLPKEVHQSVADLIEDELEIGQSAEIPRGLDYPKHIGDLTKALGILRKSGHENHPATMHIGDLAARFQDAQDIRQY